MSSTRHRWEKKVVVNAHPYKSEKLCSRCGCCCASRHEFDGRRTVYIKEYWRELERVDDGSGATPPCDARLELTGEENGSRNEMA